MSRYLYVVLGGVFLLIVIYVILSSPPSKFPLERIITIEKGTNLSSIALKLEQENIIRFTSWFRLWVSIFGGQRSVQAGDYFLPKPESAPKLAWRVVHGDRELTLVKITIPEGFTNTEVAGLFDSRFQFFNKSEFLASADEGYIFPDTYFVQINITPEEAIELFTNNFKRRIAPLEDEIVKFKHSEKDIIIMASIIEGEVQTPEDKALVSGILWKRISLGMPLQVDAAPETYKTPGLVSKPINNPGLVSIEAALRPKASPYLYFLSDKDGITHYAKTLDEHVANIQKYL